MMTMINNDDDWVTDIQTANFNPNPIGGGFFSPPPVVFFAVHLDRLEFHVQTSWLFSLKSPAYFDI